MSDGPRPLLGARDVRALLERHGLAPTKSRGQNFVVDPNTLRRAVRDVELAPGAPVVEVGPGLGSLTLALREAGHPVIAIEVDHGMARALDEVVGPDPDVHVVVDDAVGLDWTHVLDSGVDALGCDRPRALVANLPYNVATPIVMEAMDAGWVDRALVMVQREVGERWVARPGDARYGAPSAKVAAHGSARIAAAVSRAAFHPVPRVDSVTVRIDAQPWRHAVDRGDVLAWIDLGFAQRRKRLRNALAPGGRAPMDVEAALARAGLDPGARAEELDVDGWAGLASALGPPTNRVRR